MSRRPILLLVSKLGAWVRGDAAIGTWRAGTITALQASVVFVWPSNPGLQLRSDPGCRICPLQGLEDGRRSRALQDRVVDPCDPVRYNRLSLHFCVEVACSSLLVERVTVMSFHGWFVALLAVGMCWLSETAPSAYAQFGDLLARVPPNANSLVLIDVDAFYRSPMAMRKHWKENFATRSSEQPIILPPEARRFVLASHLDPLNNLRSEWEAAVIDLGEPLSLSLLARAEGGYIDSLDGTPVVWTPSRSYLIQLDKQLMGMVYPDDRQAAARWIERMKTGKLAPLSSYLQEASQRLRAEGQIVLALI